MTAGAIINLLLNLLIVGLLATTIGYCWILNRRIKVLQDSKSELAQLLKHFDESTLRASESIIALQTASKKIGENIQQRIDKANYLLDDMVLMIEKGNRITNQMEAGLAVGRARSRVITEPNDVEITREVSSNTRPTPLIEHPSVNPVSKPTNREKTAASLEAVLERIVGRKPTQTDRSEEAEAPVIRSRTSSPRARSKAEQELLDMIKTGIKG